MPEFAGIPPQGYSSQHFVNFKTADGLISYTLTGIVTITFQGAATGSDFLRKPLTFEVPIPDLPPRKGLKLRHWAPFVTLGSISNDGTAINAGWAVDDFSITNANTVMTSVGVATNLAVRDVDGFVLRVGYAIHLLGALADLPPPPK